MHATAFLQKPDATAIPPIVVLHGGEACLKEGARRAILQRVFGDDSDADAGLTRLTGREAEWRRVRDELATVSMFGDKRVVVVEDADDFVSEHRDSLETYFNKPSRQSVFVLDVKTWRSNTRLAKKLVDVGLELDCSELKGVALLNWLAAHAKSALGKQLTRDAAGLIVELAGAGLSLLEQELAKLAAYVGDRERVTVEDVRAVVGGWKAETTWKMTDAIRDGQPAAALVALGKLLHAGEAPQKILGGVNRVPYARILAAATVRRCVPRCSRPACSRSRSTSRSAICGASADRVRNASAPGCSRRTADSKGGAAWRISCSWSCCCWNWPGRGRSDSLEFCRSGCA
jgi:DNA polymerase-3 subunit delta